MQNKLKTLLKEICDRCAIKRSDLFDCEYYLRHNLDVARSCRNPDKSLKKATFQHYWPKKGSFMNIGMNKSFFRTSRSRQSGRPRAERLPGTICEMENVANRRSRL